MRLSLKADTPIERLGLALRKVPVPAGKTFTAMAVARTLGIAQQLGVFTALASAPQTAEQLAGALELRPEPTRMMLDLLAGEDFLRYQRGVYSLGGDGRRWLDPASPTYLGTFVAHTASYWAWWNDLEPIMRGAPSFEIHSLPADDPSWPVYIRGQYELARLSAASVAKAIAMPAGARSVLDLAGGHGWYSAALCQRTPGLRALVIDLPGSAAAGRQIMRETAMDHAVQHRDGNMFDADLGGPHDIVLCFSILHHLSPSQTAALFKRARAVLHAGGRIAILDMFRPEPGQARRSTAATFELFFHLTSGFDTPSERQLHDALISADFAAPKRHDLPTIPDLRLYIATTS